MRLASPAFPDGGLIQDKYSKDGGNISPPLTWIGIPSATKSVALVMDDPDAPSGTFVHWLVYGIPRTVKELQEGLPPTPTLPNGACQGRNGFGDLGYGGPQPPSGTHRYVFHLYALDIDLDLPAGASREELDQAMNDEIIEEARLMGRYQHHRSRRSRVA
jgi:Raf kinase inhibitor-like YbhB/YbcL family protein